MNVILVDLPPKIKGFTQNVDCYYTIFLNARHSRETQEKTFRHELEHIKKDYGVEISVDEIESIRHK